VPCECCIGENRQEKLDPVPLVNDTLAGHAIFSIPIVIAAGNFPMQIFKIIFAGYIRTFRVNVLVCGTALFSGTMI